LQKAFNFLGNHSKQSSLRLPVNAFLHGNNSMGIMEQTIQFDEALIKRYNQSGPRYTSYPTAVQFDETYGIDAYEAAANRSNQSDKALSLYFHIPFCDTVCFFAPAIKSG